MVRMRNHECHRDEWRGNYVICFGDTLFDPILVLCPASKKRHSIISQQRGPYVSDSVLLFTDGDSEALCPKLT